MSASLLVFKLSVQSVRQLQ